MKLSLFFFLIHGGRGGAKNDIMDLISERHSELFGEAVGEAPSDCSFNWLKIRLLKKING